MPNFLDALPEVFVSHTDISSQVSQAVSRGELRKIGSRLYTKNLADDPETIVRRHWHELLAEYYPDARIADRTALEGKPAEDGSVFIVSSKKRNTGLPGITFNVRSGKSPIESDKHFINKLRISSQPRAFLENMRPSRARSGLVSRTLSQDEMEKKLDKLFRLRGPDHVNGIRDRARSIAGQLSMEDEFDKLDRLIGRLQGTREIAAVTKSGKARKDNEPFDADRYLLFKHLFEQLTAYAPKIHSVSGQTPQERTNLSFFEAYFSNFIEGTEFEVDEAAEIVFENVIPAMRPDDAHDILGTYRVVSDYAELSKTPDNFDDFISTLKQRHSDIMASRQATQPGVFKSRINMAGATQFVRPDMVTGTLRKGFEIYRGLEYPFQKAVFQMFLVSEVHPFEDGNGRVARIMMNAELVAGEEQKIVIPTIYRNNYLAALRALTHNRQASPLVRTLDFAQKYTRAINWSAYARARQELADTKAFMDPMIADQEGIRLRLPT